MEPICTASMAIPRYTRFSRMIGYLDQMVTSTPAHAIIERRASMSEKSERFLKPLRPTRL